MEQAVTDGAGLHTAQRVLRRFAPAPFTLLLIAVAGLGTALALARQATFGAVLTYDSLEYIGIARNLLDGEGLVRWSGQVYTLWPLGYPLVLTIGSLGVLDPLSIAGPLNAGLFGLTIFVSGRFLQQRLASRFLVAWACLALALSIPLAWSAAQMLTESLFILLTTAALACLDKFLRQGGAAHLVLASAFSAFAWQTRYVGVALAAFVGLALLFQRRATLPQRGRRVALFALICGTPMAIWLTRNWLLTGTTTTHFRAPWPGLSEATAKALRYASEWLHFHLPGLPLSPNQAIGLVLGPTLIAMIAWPFLVKRPRPAGDWAPAALFGGFALTYLIATVGLTGLGAAGHGFQARYLLPLYLPLVVVLATTLDRFLAAEGERPLFGRLRLWPGHGQPRKLSNAATAVLLALSLWLAGQVMPNREHIGYANDGHLWLAYSSERWQRSETLRYLREKPLPGWIWAVEPTIVSFHNPADARYRYLPGGVGPRPSGVPELSRQLAHVSERAYLVWLTEAVWRHPDFPFGPASLRVLPGLALLRELDDGVIFRIAAEHTPAPDTNPYLSAQAAIASGELGPPLARSVFDLHLLDGKLVYAKAPCAAQDTQARFFLHVVPANAADLPADSRHRGYERLGFDFQRYGAIFDGTCLALATLPEYAIERVRTGQSERGGRRIWEEAFKPASGGTVQP